MPFTIDDIRPVLDRRDAPDASLEARWWRVDAGTNRAGWIRVPAYAPRPDEEQLVAELNRLEQVLSMKVLRGRMLGPIGMLIEPPTGL